MRGRTATPPIPTAATMIANGASARAAGYRPDTTWVALAPRIAAVKAPTSDAAVRVAQVEMFAEIAASARQPTRKATRAPKRAPLQLTEDAGAEALATDDNAPPRAKRLVWLRIYYRTMTDRIAFVDARMSVGDAQREIALAGLASAGHGHDRELDRDGHRRLYPARAPHVVDDAAHARAVDSGEIVILPSQRDASADVATAAA